jgi:predicted nucleic acid-binding protein
MSRHLYVDTNIFIYLLERHEHLSSRVATELEQFVKSPDSGLLTSTVTITEFLAGTKSTSSETLKRIPRLTFCNLDENIAERAGQLKRKNGLKIGDAIHLASAISSNAEALYTNDKQLIAIASKHLKVVHL